MRHLCTAIPNVDILQATCQDYVIINKFYKFYGILYYKNIICTALHFSEVCRDGLMMVILPQHVDIIK